MGVLKFELCELASKEGPGSTFSTETGIHVFILCKEERFRSTSHPSQIPQPTTLELQNLPAGVLHFQEWVERNVFIEGL